MEQPERETEENVSGSSAPARAEPAQAADVKKDQKTEKAAELDPYWWAPWAVLIGLVLYGLLGFLGVLFPNRKGPTAADVPAPPPAASEKRPAPAR
jgi:hypothetical protein